MIVLDASAVIAFFDPADPIHRWAREVMRSGAAQGLAVNVLTAAESMVRAAQAEADASVVAGLEALGVTIIDLPSSAARRLARIRARTRLRMPDAVVLFTALDLEATVATYDTRLAAAVRSAGLDVMSPG